MPNREHEILERIVHTIAEQAAKRTGRSLAPADHSDKISCLGARQLLDHALAGPLPLLQEDQEIGHLLPVRPLVELPDDVGADLTWGGQDPKEIPPGRWSERGSEASRILPKHRGASVSAAWRPGELLIDAEEDRTLRAVLRTPTIGLVGGAGNDVLIGARTPTSAAAVLCFRPGTGT